uniref:Uncharacterized protein n=1 Tax=Rhizophora mucronata TaxID=61149 RepID=A0A2P2NF84_RHIMU
MRNVDYIKHLDFKFLSHVLIKWNRKYNKNFVCWRQLTWFRMFD